LTATRQTTVWCDGCQAWEQASSTSKTLRKELRARGWVCVRTSQGVCDYCPACLIRRATELQQVENATPEEVERFLMAERQCR